MAFNQAAVKGLLAAVESIAQNLAVFSRVNLHEPVSDPGAEISCSIWVQEIRPVTSSGLAQTSGLVVLNARVVKSYKAATHIEYDAIDPAMLSAVSVLIGAYSGEFTIGGTVREVDLLGQFGTPLGAEAGYVPYGDKHYRAFTLTIPVVINDLWGQVQ